MDAIKQALSSLFGQQQQIASPIPAEGVLNQEQKHGAAMTAMDQAIARIRQMRPNLKQTDNELAALYAKYGDQIIPTSPSRPTQSVLGQAVQQMQGGAAAQAQAPQATPTPQPSPTLAPDATPFEQTALPILNKYGIPPAVAFGMRDAEGGKIGANNQFNINAVDSNPSAATNYATPEEGIKAFAELIAKNPRYAKAFEQRSDPAKMLQAIQDAGYAGDPKTWQKRSKETGGAGNIYKTYAQFVQDTPGFNRYSK